MPIAISIMVPHPPLIVPQVGRGSEKEIQTTIGAYQEAARRLVEQRPQVIVISSPHAPLYRDGFQVSPGAKAKGDFGQFRAFDVSFLVSYDQEFAQAIVAEAERAGLPAVSMRERQFVFGEACGELDHGCMVPLYFIREAYREAGLIGAEDEIPVPLVRLGLSGLPLDDHYRMGQAVARAAKALNRRVAFVGSGDLSHKLQADGPYGFDPAGPIYDQQIMDTIKRAAFGEMLCFEDALCRKAAECGHRSFCIMAGAFDGLQVQAQVLSHEDVTGVGYGVAVLTPGQADETRCFLADLDTAASSDATPGEDAAPDTAATPTAAHDNAATPTAAPGEDPYVALARLSLTSYIRQGERLQVPQWIPSEMLNQRAGAFVSLHKDGQLRGCIGTIEACRENLAQEIIDNAISASTRDPRFMPVKSEEIDQLEISVDVLGLTEPIATMDQLDPERYGVVVSRGRRRGLLLPMLEGIDTPQQQVSIALRKAGISESETYKMERFEVVRHQ